ncbi:MAG: sugar ABC transporter ATP-binding protein [Lachnospiraceae bacterium]|nr:sugar ABC transporter ATP-binding protein [Lachnospiraceae bacterium]
MNEFILEMKNIHKSYGGIQALKNVSLELRPGEVLCLCGENGAGKSTLMKILAGVETPTQGEIFINGKQVKITRPIDAFDFGISMVHQELVQIEEMTVAENIFVGRYKTKAGFVDNKGLREDTLKLMEQLGIYFDPDSLVRQYTVANRQLIEIAKALSHNCSIIIFDEPTAALTIEETEKLYKIIRQLKERGMAIILISHRMEDIYAVGDRVEVLKDGENSGTLQVAESKVDDIVRLMIGRQMTQQFPKKTNKPSEKILEVKGLTNSKITNISFELKKGEILGVGGLVGAGRTELLRAIFGVDSCQGEIFLRGEKIKNNSPMDGLNRGFALVPEDRKDQGLILNQSILQNVVLSILKKMSVLGIMKPKKEADVCDEYIQKLKIRTSGRNMIVQMLSGGNQQKVVLGKCLASNPDILLLDEPTRGVDVGAKAEIYKIINDLASEGMSIIVVSSEMTELLGISDRILVMHEGHLSGELSMDEASEEAIMKRAITH